MSSNKFAVVAVLLLAFGVVFAARETRAKDAKTQYPRMAPVEEYMMTDRNAEIALARSAAPESISHDATVLVLGTHGYETAVEGKNGFVCVVERAWMSPSSSQEFWNPKLRGPVCFNPPAARSVLPTTYKRTEFALAGRTITEIFNATRAAFGKGELPPLEPGSMSYMMSKQAYLTDSGDHNLAHLMFYTPEPGWRGVGCRPAKVTGHAESTIQRLATDRCVCCSGRKVVRRDSRPRDVVEDRPTIRIPKWLGDDYALMAGVRKFLVPDAGRLSTCLLLKYLK